MPKPKKEMMKSMRKARKDNGLIDYRVWVSSEEKKELEKKLEELRNNT